MLRASYAVFEYMGVDGIHVKNGASIDNNYPLDHCTFRNGVSGGRLLTINNNQSLNIVGANFPSSDFGLSYNVAKTVDQGTVNFSGQTGTFAGASHELDTYGRINWGNLPQVPTPTITYISASNSIQLSWSYPIPVTRFRIYRSDTPYGTFSEVGTSTVTTWSQVVPGPKFFYKVAAEE